MLRTCHNVGNLDKHQSRGWSFWISWRSMWGAWEKKGSAKVGVSASRQSTVIELWACLHRFMQCVLWWCFHLELEVVLLITPSWCYSSVTVTKSVWAVKWAAALSTSLHEREFSCTKLFHSHHKNNEGSRINFNKDYCFPSLERTLPTFSLLVEPMQTTAVLKFWCNIHPPQTSQISRLSISQGRCK